MDSVPADASHHRPSGIPRRTAYRKEDVPHIKFWTRKDYDAAKAIASAKVIKTLDGDSRLPFMEHEDGTPISEDEAKQMRQTARGVFIHLMSQGSAPEKWGQVSVVSQDFFFNVVAERFPFAAMGEDMWKMQLLATICYPSWHRNNKEKIDLQRRDQPFEHSRQFKEELIEVFELSGKRARGADDGPETKPSKRSRGKANRTSVEKYSTQTSSTATTRSPSVASTSTSTTIPITRPSSSCETERTVMQPLQPNPAPRVAPTLPSTTAGDVTAPSTNIIHSRDEPHRSSATRERSESTTRDPPPSSTNVSINSPPDIDHFVDNHQGSLMLCEGTENAARDLSPSSLRHPVANHETSPQTPTVLPLPTPSTSVENWAYDGSGLDTTNVQEVAMDRLTMQDSTPYFPPQEPPSLDIAHSDIFQSTIASISSQTQGVNEEVQVRVRMSLFGVDALTCHRIYVKATRSPQLPITLKKSPTHPSLPPTYRATHKSAI